MSERGYPRCGAETGQSAHTGQAGSYLVPQYCDGTLLPLSTVVNAPAGRFEIHKDKFASLTYGKWKCTKCGRVIE